MKSMGWTDKTLLQTLDQDRLTPPKELDESPFVNAADQTRQSKDTVNQLKLPAQCCANCFCDCKAKYLMPQQQTEKENLASTRSRNLDDSANRLCEHINGSKCIKKNCKYVKPRTCMITGGVELVPLLAKRRAMQRPISLSTTDVTKYPTEKK